MFLPLRPSQQQSALRAERRPQKLRVGQPTVVSVSAAGLLLLLLLLDLALDQRLNSSNVHGAFRLCFSTAFHVIQQ